MTNSEIERVAKVLHDAEMGFCEKAHGAKGQEWDENYEYVRTQFRAMARGISGEIDALRARVAELEAALLAATTTDRAYRCGCRAVRSTNIKAFCPEHHKTLVPLPGEDHLIAVDLKPEPSGG